MGQARRRRNTCQRAPLIRVHNQDDRLDVLRHTSEVDGDDLVEAFFCAIPLVAAVLDRSYGLAAEDAGLVVVARVD